MPTFDFAEAVKSLKGWNEGHPNNEDIKKLKGICAAEGLSLKDCFAAGAGSFVTMIQGSDGPGDQGDEEEEGRWDLEDPDDELSRMEAGELGRGGGERRKSRRGKSRRSKSRR